MPIFQFLVAYLGIGAAFVVYDCVFNKEIREIFKKHRKMGAIQIIRWPISIFRRFRNRLAPLPRDSSGFKMHDSSYYRRWVVKNEPAMQEKKEVDDSMMFTGLMMFLGQFNPIKKRITTSNRETPEQLGDDAALFELGCYLLSMIDRWMYGKHPDRREHFVRYAMDEFLKLSSKALSKPLEEVAQIFNQRMSRYGEMYRDSKPDVEREMIERLTDQVTYAVENGKCFSGHEAPISLSMERLETLMQLQIWVTTHGSAALDSLEKCISQLPQTQPPPSNTGSTRPSRVPVGSKSSQTRRRVAIGSKDSQFAIPPQFKAAHTFMQGLAAVNINGALGFINATGEVVIEPRFDDVAEGFSEGLAAIQVDDQWGYIDRDGRMVIEPAYDEAHPFSEGLAAVASYDDGEFGYIDTSGKLVVAPKIDSLGSFSESLARVRPVQSRAFGYIDHHGIFAIPPQFEEIGTGKFSRGIASAKKGNKCGLIDKTGRFVVEPRFDGWISDFSEGLAAVTLNSKISYIDQAGRSVIRTNFDYAERFSDGLAAVAQFDSAAEERYKQWADKQYRERGILNQGPNPLDWMRWGFIERTGKLIIPNQFERAEPFSEGLAAVRLNQQWGFVRAAP